MEPATIIAIAAASVKLLSPYLKKVATDIGDKAAENLGESVAAGAVNKVRELYLAIKGRFSGNQKAEEALTKLSATPDDANTQASLREQLEQALEQDEDFARKLSEMIKSAHQSGADSVFNINIGGDVQKLVNIGTVHGDVSF